MPLGPSPSARSVSTRSKGSAASRRERLDAFLRLLDLVALAAQQARERQADRALVLDDQQARRLAAPPRGSRRRRCAALLRAWRSRLGDARAPRGRARRGRGARGRRCAANPGRRPSGARGPARRAAGRGCRRRPRRRARRARASCSSPQAPPLARHRAAQAARGLALDEAPLELGLDHAAARAPRRARGPRGRRPPRRPGATRTRARRRRSRQSAARGAVAGAPRHAGSSEPPTSACSRGRVSRNSVPAPGRECASMRAAVGGDELLRDREAEPGALGLRGVEGVEDLGRGARRPCPGRCRARAARARCPARLWPACDLEARRRACAPPRTRRGRCRGGSGARGAASPGRRPACPRRRARATRSRRWRWTRSASASSADSTTSSRRTSRSCISSSRAKRRRCEMLRSTRSSSSRATFAYSTLSRERRVLAHLLHQALRGGDRVADLVGDRGGELLEALRVLVGELAPLAC